jgi:hypothetical protein
MGVTIEVSHKDRDFHIGHMCLTFRPRHIRREVDGMDSMVVETEKNGMSGLVKYFTMVMKARARENSDAASATGRGMRSGERFGKEVRSVGGVFCELPCFCDNEEVSQMFV